MGYCDWNSGRAHLCFTWRFYLERSKLIVLPLTVSSGWSEIMWQHNKLLTHSSLHMWGESWSTAWLLEVFGVFCAFIYSLIGEPCCVNGWKKTPAFSSVLPDSQDILCCFGHIDSSLWLLSRLQCYPVIHSLAMKWALVLITVHISIEEPCTCTAASLQFKLRVNFSLRPCGWYLGCIKLQ